MWALRSEEQRGAGRIEHVAVTNSSTRAPERRPYFEPCAIVVGSVSAADSMELGSRSYQRSWSGGALKVFVAVNRR